ncbi:septation protein SpoVG family protein [Anatilimnocola sp. NA78]|uniref:septation protein SpoVG family protein n=1 Tax=Anatilimnocola sp. NA78 TaxID=3415683 RepID=UPI003CE49A01
MEITEVRVKLMEDSDDRLQGFCSITFDNCFVVRDLKIIEGSSGPFVAMPSRKLTSHCPQCGCKNHLKAAHCNQCGSRLKDDRTVRDQEGRTKLYADIAHPINSSCREMIQNRVITEYRAELDRAKQPGYVSKYDDDYDDDVDPADIAPPSHGEERRQPQLPPGTQIHQGTESEVRPPHILPAPSPPSGPQTPHSGLAKEKREQDKPKPKNGGFGEGIF